MCTSTNPESPYPIIQHADFTLNINRTEPYTNSSTNANYAELINQINFSLPALDDFIPSSPKIYIYFYHQNTILDNTLLYQAQQQDPVIRQLILWKTYKNHPPLPSLPIRANKGLLHYYRRFIHLHINETDHLLYYIKETNPPKVCLPLSLLLNVFHNAHTHEFSGHPGREKTHATITAHYYFPNMDCNTHTRLFELPNQQINA